MKDFISSLISNKWFKIISLVSVLIIVIFVIGKFDTEDNPFNKIQLSENNLVLSTDGTCDTILRVGLDVANLSGLIVNILPLSESAKSSFNGDLNAHLRLHDGTYYLFINHNNSREELIRIISHEIIHIQQYHSKRLIYENGSVMWEGAEYDLNSISYENRPWENEAFSGQNEIYQKIYNILYK
jgi:hypothetical protein